MNTADTIAQFSKMLRNLDRWFDKAAEHAAAKKFDLDTVLQARLAPDQFPLVRQVQSACDSAKFTAAYLAGQKAPSHPDTEKTVAELRQRIATCLAYLEGFKADDFKGAEERKVAPAWAQGRWMPGEHYLAQMAIPNFYFHVTTAYAIFRNNGVDVGKMDYLGTVPFREG